MKALVFSLQSEAISYETFFYNLREGGVMRPSVTSEEELGEIRRVPMGATPEPVPIVEPVEEEESPEV